jgi:hypothetical protein
MESDYVLLCGVMWHKFGQQDAGKELLRAGDSTDPDVRALAWAMLEKHGRHLTVHSPQTGFTPETI